VGEAPRQQLGLAGAGGAEDQQRALAMADRALAIGLVADQDLLLRWHLCLR
jgi:hypothetical protein